MHNEPKFNFYDDTHSGLNRIVNFKLRNGDTSYRFFVGSREASEALIAGYIAKRAAGVPIDDKDRIAGVLCVGDSGTRVIEQTYGPQDFVVVNLAGMTDLTLDPTKFRRHPSERRPRVRNEEPQTCSGRRATIVKSLMAAQAAFTYRPEGIYVIHCEHGLHRAPAYAYGAFSMLLAEQITLNHFDRADSSELTLTLNKERHILAARHLTWKTLGKPRPGTTADPNAYWPYTRIMGVIDDVVDETYSCLTPATPRQQRDAQVAANRHKLLECGKGPA